MRSKFIEKRFGAAFFATFAMGRNMRLRDRRRKSCLPRQVAELTGMGLWQVLILSEKIYKYRPSRDGVQCPSRHGAGCRPRSTDIVAPPYAPLVVPAITKIDHRGIRNPLRAAGDPQLIRVSGILLAWCVRFP